MIRLFEPKELADLRPAAGAEALFELRRRRAAAPGRAAAPARCRRRGPAAAARARPARGARGPRAGRPQSRRSRWWRPSRWWSATGVLAGLDPGQRAAAEAPAAAAGGGRAGHRQDPHADPPARAPGRGARRAGRRSAWRSPSPGGPPPSWRSGSARSAPAKALVTTFHGLGLRIVREHAARLGLGDGFRVVDEAERLALAREALGDPASAGTPASCWSWSPGSPATRRSPRTTGSAGPLARYRAGKRARGLVDLDDLLALPVALLTGRPGAGRGVPAALAGTSASTSTRTSTRPQYALLRLLVPAGRRPVRDRRPGPGDLRVPRRGRRLLPPLRRGLPRRADRPAHPQLPLSTPTILAGGAGRGGAEHAGARTAS